MTPSELAAEVARVVAEAQSRVGPDSIGARQYYVEGQPQKFETMSFDALAQYYREELLDLVNYAVMTTIRLDRLRAELSRRIAEFDALAAFANAFGALEAAKQEPGGFQAEFLAMREAWAKVVAALAIGGERP